MAMIDISNENELFLDAVDHIVLEALAAIGDDAPSRFAFFRRLLGVVIEVTGSALASVGVPVSPARTS
jgi:hypothetical protein